MNKKKMLVAGILIGVMVIVAGVFMWNRKKPVDLKEIEPVKMSDVADGTVSLIASAKSKEEAEKIAELYGINLIDFQYGTALYETDKDPNELFEIGEKNNYPKLDFNYKGSTFSSN